MRVALFSNTAWFMYNFNMHLITSLNDAGHTVVLITPPDDNYSKKLLTLGHHWIPAPMERKSINPFKEIRLIYWLKKTLSHENIDIIQGFTIKCALYGAIATKLIPKLHSINSITGMGYIYSSNDIKAKLLRPAINRLMKYLFNNPKCITTVLNNDDKQYFNTHIISDHSLLALLPGSGVDCKKFTPAEHPQNYGTTRVLLACRLLIDKGVFDYAEASKIIKRQSSNKIEFLLAGLPDHGNPASISEKQIKQWESEGLLHWLGHVDDMPSLLRCIDIAVLPSYREGLPTGLLEAGATGLPIVTTNVTGCNDVVTHDVDGILVPAKDPAALAEAIVNLYQSKDLRERLGKSALMKVKRNFSVETVTQMTMDIYTKLRNNN